MNIVTNRSQRDYVRPWCQGDVWFKFYSVTDWRKTIVSQIDKFIRFIEGWGPEGVTWTCVNVHGLSQKVLSMTVVINHSNKVSIRPCECSEVIGLSVKGHNGRNATLYYLWRVGYYCCCHVFEWTCQLSNISQLILIWMRNRQSTFLTICIHSIINVHALS